MEKDKGVAMRSCLKCDKQFKSVGPQNRICSDCKETEVFWDAGRTNRKFGFVGSNKAARTKWS